MDKETFYRIADLGFIVFHILLILFNLFGWIYKPLRKWNLLTLSLTAFSWLILGLFYGFGYCFLTDWHWQVREQLGKTVETPSYIQFLLVEATGINIPAQTVDLVTAVLFFAVFAISIFLNVRDRKQGTN